MLRLHRLELSGFKSFVDPVSLEFAGGITAIVGPNGCGKSNLADAVAWVLGEQSARILRGERMEDVIFGGAESRRPLGMAEVSVTFLTDPAFPRSDDGRLVIGRRVFRSGESQYRLNERTVRLKEIRDLLMDTGLGIRAYSVIEQGKVGMILSGKPQERRRLLEEAAGITRYKARKRIAEVKLEEATANLLRLDDIIVEVERSLRSLKRQAGAAQRFQERQREYRELLRRTLLGRWRRLGGRLEELAERLGAAGLREAELAAALHAGEAELVATRETLEGLAEELSERARRQARLAATIEGRQEFLRGARRTLEEIGERVAAGRALAARRREEAAGVTAALAEREQERQGLAAELAAAGEGVSREERRFTEIQGRLGEGERRVGELRARLFTSLGEVSDLKNRLHREQVEHEKGSVRRRHLEADLAQRASDLEEAAASDRAAGERLVEAEARLAAADGELARLDEESARLETREADLGARRREAEQRLAAWRQRRQLLTDLAQAHAERRALLREAFAAAGLEEPAFLGDAVAAPAGWEASLDLYLGELADAVVVPAGGDPLALARSLAAGPGAVRLIAATGEAADSGAPPDAAAPGDDPLDAVAADPDVLGSLAPALGIPPGLAPALPPAYLVATAAGAARLARRWSGVAFLSRERTWSQAGTLHLQGEQAQPGALARQRELEEMGGRIPNAEKELGLLTAELAGVVAERQPLADRRAAAEEGAAALREELAVTRARREDLGARHRRLTLESDTLTTEREETDRELARVAERRAVLAAELAEAEARHAELERAFDAAQAELEAVRQERESLTASGAGARGRLDLLAERLGAHDQETSRLDQEVRRLAAAGEAWEAEEATLARRRAELEAAVVAADGELQTALEHRGAAEAAVRGEQERLEEGRGAVRALEARVHDLRLDLDAVRASAAELRVERAGRDQDAEHLSAAFREEFGAPLPAVSESGPGEGGAVPPTEAELAELEADLARAKEALERLGPVNVLAAEEYSGQEERHRTLAAQRADVAASVERLRATIREINQTSSERFLRAFQEVNIHFARTFQELFRGGEAEMRLLDEDDLLESGIEIVARPPGKRLQNLMLLSGGEKALTAIALLFALFRTRPSPFCILDEVDAPLDDVNTLRFVELLRRMTAETQFIVVTHNKLTMEAAGRLYGVTMEEKGVSKVVAVELEEVQPHRQESAAAG